MMTPRSSFSRRTHPFWWSLSCVMFAAFLLTACGGGGTTATPTATPPPPPATPTSPPTSTPTVTATTVMVTIVEKNEQYSFSPAALTIKAGTTVVWKNASDAPHTVISDQGGVFGTESPITEGQTFSFTFPAAGTFAYHCSLHPYMKASVTVTS